MAGQVLVAAGHQIAEGVADLVVDAAAGEIDVDAVISRYRDFQRGQQKMGRVYGFLDQAWER